MSLIQPASSNYPNISGWVWIWAKHLAPERWSKRMKLKLRVTRKEWWASLAARPGEERRGEENTAWAADCLCQTRGNRIQNPGHSQRDEKNWAKTQWNVTIANTNSELGGSEMNKLWQGEQFVLIMSTGVEIPFWIFGQQKWVSGINRNTTCQEVSAWCLTELSRRRMGWEYAKMFPWLISDHVHCVSSYAQIRIVISKGKKV